MLLKHSAVGFSCEVRRTTDHPEWIFWDLPSPCRWLWTVAWGNRCLVFHTLSHTDWKKMRGDSVEGSVHSLQGSYTFSHIHMHTQKHTVAQFARTGPRAIFPGLQLTQILWASTSLRQTMSYVFACLYEHAQALSSLIKCSATWCVILTQLCAKMSSNQSNNTLSICCLPSHFLVQMEEEGRESNGF